MIQNFKYAEYSLIFKYGYIEYVYFLTEVYIMPMQTETFEQLVLRQYNNCFPDSKLNYLSVQMISNNQKISQHILAEKNINGQKYKKTNHATYLQNVLC